MARPWRPARAWPPSSRRASARWSRAAVDRIRRLFRRLQLPVNPPPADPGKFLAAMGMDKKVVAGQIRLVLLDRIGAARITGDYPPHELVDYLREQFVR